MSTLQTEAETKRAEGEAEHLDLFRGHVQAVEEFVTGLAEMTKDLFSPEYRKFSSRPFWQKALLGVARDLMGGAPDTLIVEVPPGCESLVACYQLCASDCTGLAVSILGYMAERAGADIQAARRAAIAMQASLRSFVAQNAARRARLQRLGFEIAS